MIDSCARPGNSVGGSTLWGGCHWYPLCNFLLAGGWWLWLNLGFSPCHQHYCVGIPRVPALRILCHILSCQLWTMPAGPVAWHNTDYVSPARAPAYAISHTHIHTLSIMPSHSFSSPPPFPPSITHHLKPHTVIQQHCFIYFSPLPLTQAMRLSIMLCRSAGHGHRWRRRVTPGLRCNSRGRATWVLVITAKCLGRAGLVLVGTDWDSG